MDTANQFLIFALCVGVGYCGGVIYEAFCFLRVCFGVRENRRKRIGAVLDISFFVALTVWVVFCSYVFTFPSFRVYMWTGYLLGGIIYLKTLHKIIAFFEIMWYNSIKKLINKARNQEKTLIKEEKKR